MQALLKGILFIILFIPFLPKPSALAQEKVYPQLGAEIFLEPGQKVEDIDSWVKTMAEGHFSVARVFVLWNYIETKPDKWDFTLYDALFRAAEKYGIKITPTLVPNEAPYYWGREYFYLTHDMGMYRTKVLRERSKVYIEKVVERYKSSPALDSWWLYNEPNGFPRVQGNNSFENWELGIDEFRSWLREKYTNITALNLAWQSYFSSFQEIVYDPVWMKGGWVWQGPYYDWYEFNSKFINDQISWIRKEIWAIDSLHKFTTNPPGIFNSLGHYDLKGMAETVDFLGASLHPSWFFSMVPREKYGFAVSWINDLLYGVAGSGRPYWVSELQGGSNWHSKFPLNPSPEDIANWTWTSIGSGASRVIYWLLNARMQGNESTEWALLDFQQNPSERMKQAIEIGKIIDAEKNNFSMAKPYLSPITILVSSRSLLMEERKFGNSSNNIAAVNPMAHQKAAMAFYNSLMQLGIPVQVKLINNLEANSNLKNQIAIIPNAISLTLDEINKIKLFVAKGNEAIITGLTGLYDENEKSWIVNRKSPMDELVGGAFKDILSDSVKFGIPIEKLQIFNQLIYSEISPLKSRTIGEFKGKIVGTEFRFEKGKVVWIPSLIGVGAWEYGDKGLSQVLYKELGGILNNIPFRFSSYSENCYQKVLKTPSGYITMLFNEGNSSKDVQLVAPQKLNPIVLFGPQINALKNFSLPSKSTIVLEWK